MPDGPIECGVRNSECGMEANLECRRQKKEMEDEEQVSGNLN